MAPEILRGMEADHRIDIWALGVVLYEAASGQLPFKGRTAFEISSSILHDLPPQLPSRVPTGVWAIIQRCLSKEPAHRYQQAGEVQAALEAVQAAATIFAAPVSPSDLRGPLTTIHRGIRHLAVKNGDVLLLVGTTWASTHTFNPRDQRRSGRRFHGMSPAHICINHSSTLHVLLVQ